MKKVLILMLSTVGSGVGWWVGAHVGIMTAFMVSMVGFGLGTWLGARFARNLGY